MRTAAPGTELIHDPTTYDVGPPLDVLDRLRESDGVVWVAEPPAPGFAGGPGYWLILRHADVEGVLKAPATFSSHLGATQVRDPATPEALAYVRRMMLNMDPPEHTRLRRPLQKSFTARAVARLERQIEGHVESILDRTLTGDGGTVDFAKEISADLPLLTLADVLGVPPEDRLLLFDWANRVIGFQDPDYATSATFQPTTGTGMARAAMALRPAPDAEGRMPDPRTREGMPDLYHYAHLLGRQKREDPGSDVMSILMAHGSDDTISVEEFENMFWLFAVAGNETLRNGLPGGMYALLSHPQQQRLLRSDPSLLDRAVEEMLRWWTPVMVFRRTAAEPAVVGGQPIAAGDKVVVSFLSANRDPRVFTHPATFDITRDAREHLVFGYGPHFCLGAHLARVQMRTLFRQLLERTSWLEPAGSPTWLRSSFQRGVKSLPIRWTSS
ncbi:cytochrome P450 [Cumulibacter manganitolerans]|uniref:cytochrome P450 n=1 Tax=Cumulibacter manganitolerans TaxID=1884992 RepID=UPI0012952ADB|nr:cytochrome P450 [Cumulibacter manganitolerans]